MPSCDRLNDPQTLKHLASLLAKLDRDKTAQRSLARNLAATWKIAGRPRGQDLLKEAKKILAELDSSRRVLGGKRIRMGRRIQEAMKRLASSSVNYNAFLAVGTAFCQTLDPHIDHWFLLRQRAAIREALSAAWSAILIYFTDAVLDVSNHVIHEKTLESSVLFHTTQSISTELDLDTLLSNIVLHASMLLKAPEVFLFLTAPKPVNPIEPSRLILRAWNQTGEAWGGEYSIRFGEGLVGQTAESREARIDNDYGSSDKKMPFLREAERIVSAPIIFSDEMLGVLLAADRRSREPFDASVAQLFSMYATQIAIALKNVLLYQEQSKVTRELAEKNEMLESQADLILRKSAQLVVLSEVAQKINSSLEIAEVLELLARQAAESIGVDRSVVWLFDEQKVFLDAVAGYGVMPEQLKQMNLHLSDIRGTQFFNCLSQLKPVQIQAGQDEVFFSSPLHGQLAIKSLLVVPMIFKEQAIGLIAVDDTREIHEFLEDEQTLVSSVANHTVMAIENARLYQKVKEQAITDGLTGVYNHRFFQLRFTEEFAHCKRYNNDLSLIMLDIDHFKSYNDTYGHIAGDLALKEIANLTRVSVRENDVVSRYGGEEFVVILPMTNLDGAIRVAERIRQAVETCKFLGDLNMPQVSITVSLGLATYSSSMKNREELLQQADTALYGAKENGRNRFMVYEPGLSQIYKSEKK